MAEEVQLHIQTIGPPATTIIEPAPPMVLASIPAPEMAPDAQKGENNADDTVSSCTSDSEEEELEQCDCVTETAAGR